MSFVYDKEHVELLKRSAEQVGKLQAVIVDQDGKVLLGNHRKFAKLNWPERRITVKDDLHRELIVLHGNIQRQMSKEEAKHRLLKIAKILVSSGVPKENVCQKIAELVPWTESYVAKILPKEFKHSTGPKPKPKYINRITPIDVEKKRNELRTALSLTTNREDQFPFPNCKCKTCPNKDKCYE